MDTWAYRVGWFGGMALVVIFGAAILTGAVLGTAVLVDYGVVDVW